MVTPGRVEPRRHRLLRRVGRFLLLVVGVYLVGRGAVELFLINPTRPETYRNDWGGPHYLGVLAVHLGPGLLVLVLAARRLGRR